MSRRRVDGIRDLFRHLAKLTRDLNRGKLAIHPLGYWFSGDGWQNAQGVKFASTTDVNGDVVSLRKRRTVSNCPEPPDGAKAPEIRKGEFQVLNTVCLKCQHRLPAGCCARLIEIRREEAGR